MKIAKDKVKSDEVIIRNLSEEIRKLEKEKPPVDNRSEGRQAGYTAKIQKYQEEILEIKEVIQQLERDSPVEELEEKRRKWLTLTGKRRAVDGKTYTGWHWFTICSIFIGSLLFFTIAQEFGYFTGEDWPPCTQDRLDELATQESAKGLTEDELAEECRNRNAVNTNSLILMVVLGTIYALLTYSRLQTIDGIISDIDEYNAKIQIQKSEVGSRRTKISSIGMANMKRDKSWNESVKSFEKSQTKLEKYRVKLEGEEINLSKSNMKVDELKKQISDNKKLIKSLLESVNHLVPYNEHI